MAPHRAPILVVEDNFQTRDVLQRVLAIRGYVSVIATDATEGLDYLRSGKPVCLVILDLHLPGRDGRDFLRELKADPKLAAVPVVVYSGDPGHLPDAAAFVRKGSDDPDVLLAAIERHRLKE